MSAPASGQLRVVKLGTFRLRDEQDETIAYTYSDSEQAQANAERLARAWNSHSQLVEALEAMLASHDSYPAITSLPEMPHWTQARAALAAAAGKEQA